MKMVRFRKGHIEVNRDEIKRLFENHPKWFNYQAMLIEIYLLTDKQHIATVKHSLMTKYWHLSPRGYADFLNFLKANGVIEYTSKKTKTNGKSDVLYTITIPEETIRR